MHFAKFTVPLRYKDNNKKQIIQINNTSRELKSELIMEVFEFKRGEFRPFLRKMKVGQTIAVAAWQSSYARTACSTVGFEINAMFRTFTDRENRVLLITRES